VVAGAQIRKKRKEINSGNVKLDNIIRICYNKIRNKKINI
jgi:hypothetical protein